MPALFLYLTKVSICLAVLYLFYRLVLQQLTFYNLNRWYLLGYSLLSFFIPFVNISAVLDKQQLSSVKLVQAVPVLSEIGEASEALCIIAAPSWSGWDILQLVFITGTTIMLVRISAQWLSFLNIRRRGTLLSKGNINLYEVNKDIIPFSFGRSVFINPTRHNPEELKEILHHEYVHVRQKHSVDIVCAEILCLVNWFNPFAWLIRYSIRQNLEFIADHKVLEKGVEKRQYQYLLLKVMGIPELRIAASFNLSSIRKRIVMMNKIKTAKVHLVKFLFVLPMLAVLLLAFRINIKKNEPSLQNPVATISGLVVQAHTDAPLSNVHFKEAFSKIEGYTNERGFYTLTIPVTSYPVKVNLLLTREGFAPMEVKSEFGNKDKRTDVNFAEFVGMVPGQKSSANDGSFINSMPLPVVGKTGQQQNTYESIAKLYEQIRQSRDEGSTVLKQIAGSQEPYRVVNGHTYLVSAAGSMASVDTITNIVFVDGKKMTGQEVNQAFTRNMIRTIGAMDKESAMKKYGVNEAVMEIYFKERPVRGTEPKTSSN